MNFSSLLNLEVDVYRHTDTVVGETQITEEVSVDYQLSDSAVLEVDISGCSEGTGTVFVAGTASGSSAEELFEFTRNDSLIGLVEFSSLAGITTQGFVDEGTVGNIEVLARDPSGEPVKQYALLYEKKRVRIAEKSFMTSLGIQGIKEEKSFVMHFPTDMSLQLNDKVITEDDNTFILIENPMPIRGNMKIHHYRVDIREEV